jgi:hypothetical protein
MAADSYGSQNQPQYAGSGIPQDAADLSQVSNYAAKVGNRKYGTTADFNSLAGADVWPGLEFYNVDTNLVYVRRSDNSWYRLGGGIYAGSRAGQAVGSASLSTLGPFTRNSGLASRDDFVTSVTATSVNLNQGEYVASVTYSTGGATLTGRSFVSLSCNGFSIRGFAGSGEDTWGATLPFSVGAAGAGLSVQVYLTSSVTVSGTASLSIVRVG